MKKLYLLLLMFSIFALPSITTHGYVVPTDYEIIPGLTLTDLFENNNIAPSITTDIWTKEANSVFDNDGYILKDNINSRIGIITTEQPLNSIYYMRLNVETNSFVGTLRTGNWTSSEWFVSTFLNDFDAGYKIVGRNGSRNNIWFYINPFTSGSIKINGLLIYNLTTIGIDTFTTDELNQFYTDYLSYIDYTEGYNQGELDGYASGLQDNTAYVQGYNVGYTDGLTEGVDMETGSSILIFVVAAIGFIMMIFGFTTRRGIFNLLSVGAFVVLGAMLAQYIGFIIIAIGLVIINVYYAFWGDL